MKIALPNKTGRTILSIYTGILGILYLSVGVAEILAGLGIFPETLIDVLFIGRVSMNKIPWGFTLGIIGTTFLYGIRQFKTHEENQIHTALSFQFVGLLLAVIFLGLSMLIMGAHWFSAILSSEKFSWLIEFWPKGLLFLLALPGFLLLLRREDKWPTS